MSAKGSPVVLGYARLASPKATAAIAASAAGAPFEALDAAQALRRRAGDLPLSASAAFGLARALADQSADRLASRLPDVFDVLVPGASLRPAFVAALTLRLSLKELPGLVAFLSADGSPAAPRVLVDPLLDAAQLQALRARLAVPHTGDLVVRGTSDLDVVAAARMALPRRSPWPWRGGSRPAPAAGVVLCGAESDVPYASAVVATLGDRGGSTVLAKNDRPETRRAVDTLLRSGAVGATAPEDVARLPWRRSSYRRLAAALQGLQVSADALRGQDAVAARRHLQRLLASARVTLGLEAFLRHTRPTLVVGALDRSPYGPLLAVWARQLGFRTVNVQHGAFMALHVLDLVESDLALTWNRHSAAALHADGFAGSSVVVGNPHWDGLAAGAAASRTGRAAAALRSWAAGRRLVVVLPQPVRGFLLSPSALERLYRTVLDLALARPDVCVLVKQRARDEEDRASALLAPLMDQGRARTVPAADLRLADALAAADLAVSVYSTALADAVAMGVPAASIDPDGAVRALGLDFAPLVSFCADVADLGRALDDARRPAQDADRASVMPTFVEPYAARLSTALREEGLLPARRRR